MRRRVAVADFGGLDLLVNNAGVHAVANAEQLYRSGPIHGLDPRAAVAACIAESRTGRVTTADEVGGLVAYLASSEADQITGAAVPIDGGRLACSRTRRAGL